MTRPPVGSRPKRYAPRLRRRLALAFAGAIAVTALALSAGSYLLVSSEQEQAAVDESLAQARFNLVLAEEILPPDAADADYDRLLRALAIRGDFQTLIVTERGTYQSGPQVSPALVEDGLSRALASGRLSFQTVTLGGERALAVGSQGPRDNGSIYFFFPQGEREAALARLRDVLLGIGLFLAVVGSGLGYLLARATLRPVSRAAAAAARMAAGELSTRLPTGPDEFGALADSFNRMAQTVETQIGDLESARRRERRFAGDVTHELRTPVAALVGEASLLAKALEGETLGEDGRRAAELMVRDVARLRRLIEDLLEMSRLDAGAEEVRLEEFDVAVFLRQMAAARSWPDDVAVRDPTRTAEPVATALVVVTDRRRLERVVVNLVENALRHGRPPVWVDARITEASPERRAPEQQARTAPQLEVTVTDHGPGIPPEELALIFDRFHKTDPSRSSLTGSGSGLGLAIARENARLLGGSLQVKSAVGEGTRFTLRLPGSTP